jgi:hypothetical protein
MIVFTAFSIFHFIYQFLDLTNVLKHRQKRLHAILYCLLIVLIALKKLTKGLIILHVYSYSSFSAGTKTYFKPSRYILILFLNILASMEVLY